MNSGKAKSGRACVVNGVTLSGYPILNVTVTRGVTQRNRILMQPEGVDVTGDKGVTQG
jgi:hypothetical protein